MNIKIYEGDITEMDVDCLVNAANTSLLGGGGVDGAIHKKAGPKLLEECKELGGCYTGDAKITRAYKLKASYIIHTVGPVYSGTADDEELLRKSYINSLDLAKDNKIKSIAFPAISTGVYGYPKEEAAKIAIRAIKDWDMLNNYDIDIYLVAYNKDTLKAYKKFINI